MDKINVNIQKSATEKRKIRTNSVNNIQCVPSIAEFLLNFPFLRRLFEINRSPDPDERCCSFGCCQSSPPRTPLQFGKRRGYKQLARCVFGRKSILITLSFKYSVSFLISLTSACVYHFSLNPRFAKSNSPYSLFLFLPSQTDGLKEDVKRWAQENTVDITPLFQNDLATFFNRVGYQ